MLDIFIVLLSLFVFYRLYSVLGTHSSSKKIVSSSSLNHSKILVSDSSEYKKNFPSSGLKLPNNFDESHFMQGAFLAYKRIIQCFFAKDMFPCSNFLSINVKKTFEDNFSSMLHLNQQNILDFSLKSVVVTNDGIEAFVHCKNELIVHNIEKNSFETLLLNHQIGFLNPSKTTKWICISVDQN